jgi:GTP cyclohydrolase I
MLRDILFRSVCEHHLLPFRGHAHIAYLPGERVVGLGALPKVVEILSSRPQVQERLGEQIADAIAASLDTRGVLVVLDATHECVTMRGGKQTDASTVTIAARGELAEPAARAELIALLAGPLAASRAPGVRE